MLQTSVSLLTSTRFSFLLYFAFSLPILMQTAKFLPLDTLFLHSFILYVCSYFLFYNFAPLQHFPRPLLARFRDISVELEILKGVMRYFLTSDLTSFLYMRVFVGGGESSALLHFFYTGSEPPCVNGRVCSCKLQPMAF